MREATAELVRIDGQGAAHPIGAVASQRMRSRLGEFRLLPSPPHVVLMRYTGMDGRRDAEDGAIVRLAGEITEPGAVCDILAMLAQSGPRGEFVVFDNDDTRTLYFDSGNIVGAKTTADREHLGTVLYDYGAIRLEDHQRVMERVAAGHRYGESAIELGYVTPEDIYRFLRLQMAEVAFGCMLVADGTYFFLDGFDEQSLASRHSMSAAILLMDGVTRMDEMKYFRKRIPSNEHIPNRLQARPPPAEELVDVWAAIDGQRDLDEIGRYTGKGEFATTKAVYSLMQSKHVELKPPPVAGGAAAVVETANEILVAFHQAAEEAGKLESLRSSLESFRVGAGVHDILFRGAGPDPRGTFDAEAVEANLERVAAGASPIEMLKQLVEEYVGFAIFSAESMLSPECSQRLKVQVGSLLAALRPAAPGR